MKKYIIIIGGFITLNIILFFAIMWPVFFPDEPNAIPLPPSEAVALTKQDPDSTEALKHIKTSIIGDEEGHYVAFIDGYVTKEGDIISAEYKGKKYFWKVTSITENQVNVDPWSEDNIPKKSQ
mgnify:CR=1 FL=1